MTSTYAPTRVVTPPRAGGPVTRPVSRTRRFFRDPAWPLKAALLGFPIFWLLGLGEFGWPLMAPAMVYQLWRLRRPVRVPPYFGLWFALLLWVLAGGLLVPEHVPGTLTGSGGFTGWGLRVIDMMAATIVLLYVGNLTESELPTRKVVRWLGFLFVVTVTGGVLGMVLGNVAFSSPFELILPHSFSSNYYVHQLIHPGFAQVQDVLGHTSPRPKAPYAYTNTWGNNLSLLLIWFVVGWWVRGSERSRILAVAVIAVALIPVIYSLNRGVWIGLGLTVLFLACKLAARGRFAMLGSVLAFAAAGALIFALTPLNSIVTQRLHHGQSNSIRSSLDTQAFHAALESPIIGWGTTRSALGSPSSIAVGKTPSCPNCGNAPIGSTGEIWSVLIANGVVGAGFFLGFLLLVAFHYRHDQSPEAIAARLALYLTPFYALFYPELPSALSVAFVGLGLMWRANSSPPRLRGIRT
jgi:hypothetical protein